jgi:hypothetical protein
MAFDPNTSIFAGMDRAALQQALTNAQAKRLELAMGEKVVNVEVTGGGQHRSVTYRNDPNSLAMLDDLIRQLQSQLGIIPEPRARRRLTFN